MSVCGPQRHFAAPNNNVASLIGHWGQALSGHPPPVQCRCLSRARASLRNRLQGRSMMGFENEAEQSIGRPCHQTNGRSKRPNELTSSIVPRGTSFHRLVELECSPITFDPARLSCCYDLPGPAELGAVNPYTCLLYTSSLTAEAAPSRGHSDGARAAIVR